ncbi:YybS family protein [Acetobacterium tundrae]|uniref:DUF2232 domain-containing protein n=1 Tax=Acetobacterium tundrae TaxID=132932 RepID=A0ABR6WMN1_9FIRM|nr:DUF2232 domain-containing protein [Acetobacterium tundrae]MBC3797739.1 DUF2232 domain-containing protein [Acetobacterium tundrae]
MKTRGITEGALFCALAVILTLICYYIPFLVILVFFIPVPMVVLGKRQGLKVSIISSLAATILIFLFMDPITALSFGALMFFVGCSLGFAYYKNISPVRKVIVGAVGFGILLIAVVLGYQFIMGVNFTNYIFQMMETSTKEVMNIYETSNMIDASQLTILKDMMDARMQTLKLVLPSTLLLLPVLFSTVNIVVCDFILKRIGYSVQGFEPLSQWKIPASLKYFLAIFIVGDFIISVFQITAIPDIYIYTFIVFIDLIFLVMGISFIFDFMEYKKVHNKGLKVLVVFVALLLQSFVTLLGVADVYLGLRMIFRRETQKK